MSFVIPGQYITPSYKVVEGKVHKYIPGRGATNITVSSEGATVPVVLATLLGRQVVQEITTPKPADDTEEKPTNDSIVSFLVSVVPKSVQTDFSPTVEVAGLNQKSINLPQENDIVLVKVTKLNQRQANVEIIAVEGGGNVVLDSGVGALGEVAHNSVAVGGGSQALSSVTAIASSQSTPLAAQAADVGESFRGIIRPQDVRSTDRDKVEIIDCFRPGDIVRAQILSLGDGSNYYLSTARNDLGVVFARSDGGAGPPMVPLDWQTMMCEKTGKIEPRKCAKPFV